jgi:HNH endonuclease.
MEITIRKKKIELNLLIEIVKKSESFRDVKSSLGFSKDDGSLNVKLKSIFKDYNINYQHFRGQGHQKNKNKKIPIEEYLSNKRKITSHKLRNRLLEEGIFEHKCFCCGNTLWLGNPIPLELHHKDGNKLNNNLSNLELRCPNCHYFTDTYKSKNRTKINNKDKTTTINKKLKRTKKIKQKTKKHCPICNTIISSKSTLCINCEKQKRRKEALKAKEEKGITREFLKQEIRTKPFTTIAKEQGVSDNAIRKWCKKFNLPHKSTEIKKYSDEEWEKI